MNVFKTKSFTDFLLEKEKIVLPSAPRSVRGPAYNDAEIPKEPPFTAHIGNLSFDLDDDDVYNFFKELDVIDLKLPRNENSKLRGYGYITFATREDLIDALVRHEQVKCKLNMECAMQQPTQSIRKLAVTKN